MTLSAGAARASAQDTPAVALDPSSTGQETTLLVTAEESLLSTGGQSADSVTLALARGMQVDPTAVERLCTQAEATRSACPASSQIGFGRFVLAVRGYALGGGEVDLAWSINAYLGEPLRHGDVASVALTTNLLGAGSVAALLAPLLDTSVPGSVTTVGRIVRPASGAYGVELSFPRLPVQFGLPAPITVTPARLELSLGAVRRTRENFVHRIRIKTPSGYQVRKIRDHRLVAHYLLRTPLSCDGSWPAELRVDFAGTPKPTASPIACVKAAVALP